MITSLTPSQQAKIQDYIDLALSASLSTERLNREEATRCIKEIHSVINGKGEPVIHFVESPLQCIKENSRLNSQLYSQLVSQLYSQLRSQLVSQLYSQLVSQLDSQLYSQLVSQLDSQLYSQLDSQLRSELRSELRSYSYISFWRWNSYYYHYYYIRNELFPERIKDFPLLDKYINWVKNLHVINSVDNEYYVSERPIAIHMVDGKLHSTKGPAVEYADGSSLYSINGKAATEEEIKRIKHNNSFDKVIDSILE